MNWYSNEKISLILFRGIAAVFIVYGIALLINPEVSNTSFTVIVLVPLLLTIFNLYSHFNYKKSKDSVSNNE